MKRRWLAAVVVAGFVALLASGVSQASPSTTTQAGTALAMTNYLSANPADTTPQIPASTMDNPYTVSALAASGGKAFVGGVFPSLLSANGKTTYPRQNFGTFDLATGAVGTFANGFNPTFDGQVLSIEPSTDGSKLYVGGDFTHVNGVATRGLVALSTSTGQIVTTFRPLANSMVSWVENRCNTLWVAGTFSAIGGAKVVALATLDPTTGKSTGYQNVVVAGTSASGVPTQVERFDINPQCTDLTAIGNFGTVAGSTRHQAFRLNLAAGHPTLSSWYTPQFNVVCSTRFPHWLRAVTYSPDGNSITLAGSGTAGPTGQSTLCDAMSRWVVGNTSSSATPLWVQKTGGDSFFSVADTGKMVCAGGHERWADNPLGRDNAGAGAQATPGLTCVDPTTGKSIFITVNGHTYRWVPTRSRGVGAEALLLVTLPGGTPAMLIGSDTGAGSKLGCSQPGAVVDCTQPLDQPTVAGKVGGCTSNSNFADCIGLRQETHGGIGLLPMLP